MKQGLIFIAAATAMLAACDNEPQTIEQGPYDPQADMLANEMENVELPPSIVASHTYRCKDNSLVSIDWLSNGDVTKARVTPDGGSATTLDAVEDGEGYAAGEATLSGEPQGETVTYNGQSCSR